MTVVPGTIARWLHEPSERIERRPGRLRLRLCAGDDRLDEPSAWAGVAGALAGVGPVGQLEVAVPEAAERLVDVAVSQLVRQGLRFLQLQYEADGAGGGAFVALFLPSEPAPVSTRPDFALHQE